MKNLGNCGSAGAFVAAALAESRIKIARGDTSLNPNLSEQHLLSCSTTTLNNGCDGGNIYAALQIIQTNGIVSEGCFPYTATNGNCAYICSNWQDNVVQVTGLGRVVTRGKSS